MHKRTLSLVLITIATLALTGCSRNPVAPQTDLPTDPSASSSRGIQTEDPAPVVEGGPGATGSVYLEAHEAGVLSVGRWSLTIHKNSHLQAFNIAMTVTDPEAMEVTIEVWPASANVFQVPLELVADCSDQPNLLPSENGIFFWDGAWTLADDQNVQEGTMVFKAKTNQLASAKIGTHVEVVKGRK